jgi:hypothetical protein
VAEVGVFFARTAGPDDPQRVTRSGCKRVAILLSFIIDVSMNLLVEEVAKHVR